MTTAELDVAKDFPNAIFLKGKIKNIQKRGTTNTIVTANITQRDSDGKAITTMPLVFINNGDSVLRLEQDTEVHVVGNLKTRFDRRPGIDNADRYKPYTQIEVKSIQVL